MGYYEECARVELIDSEDVIVKINIEGCDNNVFVLSFRAGT